MTDRYAPHRPVDFDVSIIGLGRVGLPLALSFADRGLRCSGIDNDPERLEAVREGRMPFEEPGTDELLAAPARLRPARALQPRRRRRPRRRTSCITLGTPSLLAHRDRHPRHPLRARRPAAGAASRPRGRSCARPSPPARPSSSPATSRSSAASTSGADVFVAHAPERIAAGRFLEEIVDAAVHRRRRRRGVGRAGRRAVRGLRRADRADDAGPGRAREDLDEHPALHARSRCRTC